MHSPRQNPGHAYDDTVGRDYSHSALIGDYLAFVTTPRPRQKAALIFPLGVGWGGGAARRWFGLFNLKIAYIDAHLRYLTYSF